MLDVTVILPKSHPSQCQMSDSKTAINAQTHFLYMCYLQILNIIELFIHTSILFSFYIFWKRCWKGPEVFIKVIVANMSIGGLKLANVYKPATMICLLTYTRDALQI